MTLLFCMQHFDAPAYQRCLEACNEQRRTNRFSTFTPAHIKEALAITELPTPLNDNLLFCATCAPLITECLKGNPRQVKRFLNAFLLRKRLAIVAHLDHIHDDVLVKLMVLEYAHPTEFRELFDWQAKQEGFPKQLQQLEANTAGDAAIPVTEEPDRMAIGRWNNPLLQRWLAMPPKLTDIDLRDYFWIARDRLDSTLSDVEMIAPVVRMIFTNIISSVAGQREAGVSNCAQLTSIEYSQLLGLLQQQLRRHPEDQSCHNAYRALVEGGVDGSSEAYVEALGRCPADKIPPAVGFDLLALIRSHSQFKPYFTPILEHWKITATRVGIALKTQMP